MESARRRAAVLLVLGAIAAFGYTINEHYRRGPRESANAPVAQTRVELPLAATQPAPATTPAPTPAPALAAAPTPAPVPTPAGTVPTPTARPANAQSLNPRAPAVTQAQARPRAVTRGKHGHQARHARHGRKRHHDAAPPVEMPYYPPPYELYPPYGEDYFYSERPAFQGEVLNGQLNLGGLSGGVGAGAAYGGGGGGVYFGGDTSVNLGAQAAARAAAVNRLAARVR